MIHTININIAVDVVAALSDKSLEGHIYVMDDSTLESENQGTENLITSCIPGQLIRWKATAIDLQTPLSIKKITFLNHEDNLNSLQEQYNALEGHYPKYGDGANDTSEVTEEDSKEESNDSKEKDAEPQVVCTDIKEQVTFNYHNLDLNDWTGYVPENLVPGKLYKYRLDLQMGEGIYSSLSIATTSLRRV